MLDLKIKTLYDSALYIIPFNMRRGRKYFNTLHFHSIQTFNPICRLSNSRHLAINLYTKSHNLITSYTLYDLSNYPYANSEDGERNISKTLDRKNSPLVEL